MANKAIAIPRLDDQTALSLFRKLNAKRSAENFRVDLAGFDAFNFKGQLNEDQQRITEFIDRPGIYLITSMHLSYPNYTINYSRGGVPGQKNLYIDEIAINGSAGGLPNQGRLELFEILNHFLAAQGITTGELAHEEQDHSALETTYRATVLKLEAKFADQIEKITSWTVEQAQAYEDRKLQLTNETQEERQRLQAEHDKNAESLKVQAAELEERRKALDDRDYMHARRGIRGDLQKTIQDRQQKFTLTTDTRRLRWPVHAVMLALLAFLAVINVIYIEHLVKLDIQTASWPLLLWGFGKQGLAALAFVGVVLYYVRWLNRWFEQHSAAEFWLRQFQLDFDRASWVVESALEWRRDQKTEIPVPLLEGITRNLFLDRDHSAERSTATDDLASALVGNASQVKLRVGENEISLDRKGLAGLSKTDTGKVSGE